MKTKYNWKEIQKDYDENNLTYRGISKKYGAATATIVNAGKTGKFKPRCQSEAIKLARKNNPNIGKMTEATKKKISKSMKKFMKENPEKCPYLQNHYSKGDSYPERYFKECFNGKFQEKFRILNYQLDFADVENKIDIEIDGEQHFVDSRIKKSDDRRNKALTELGWSIIRIRWSLFQIMNKTDKQNLVNCILNNKECDLECYLKISSDPNEEKIKKFYNTHHIKKTKTKNGYEYRSLKTKPCPECGNLIQLLSKRCDPCNKKFHRKTKWPSKIELENIIWTKPTVEIAKDYGVSEATIRKWCKLNNVRKPPVGYWKKLRSGLTHEEALNPKSKIQKPKYNKHRELSKETVLEIRSKFIPRKDNFKELSEIYNVSTETIRNIRYGRTYKDWI